MAFLSVITREGLPPMSAWFLLTIAAVVVTLQAPPASAVAADPPPDRVAATLADVDEDFAFQGEYYGDVRAVDGRRVVFGLQVVALGDGRFSALGYQGGLPGNGWDRENFITWNGSRQADVLTFRGERGTVIISQGRGRVIDSAGVAVDVCGKCTASAPRSARRLHRAPSCSSTARVLPSSNKDDDRRGLARAGCRDQVARAGLSVAPRIPNALHAVRARAGAWQQWCVHSAAL